MGWWCISLKACWFRLFSPHLLLQISFCVYTILGVVKRARWPATTEEAKAGGFFLGYLPSGTPMYRNPCTEQVLKLFDNLLALIRWVKLTWNHLCWLINLWKPDCDKYVECSKHVCPVKPVGIQAGVSAQVLFLTVHSGEWHWGNWSLLKECSWAWPAGGHQS